MLTDGIVTLSPKRIAAGVNRTGIAVLKRDRTACTAESLFSHSGLKKIPGITAR
jgi:hypothetical protein